MTERTTWLEASRRACALIRVVCDMPDLGTPQYTPEQRARMERYMRRVEAESRARDHDDGGIDDKSR